MLLKRAYMCSVTRLKKQAWYIGGHDSFGVTRSEMATKIDAPKLKSKKRSCKHEPVEIMDRKLEHLTFWQPTQSWQARGGRNSNTWNRQSFYFITTMSYHIIEEKRKLKPVCLLSSKYFYTSVPVERKRNCTSVLKKFTLTMEFPSAASIKSLPTYYAWWPSNDFLIF